MERPLVILDVETSGFRHEDGHEIIEIAAQKIVRDRVLDEFHALVRNTRPLDPDTIRVHGITEALLAAEGKQAATVFPTFVTFVGHHPIVGHNVLFDLGFLNAALARLGLPPLANPRLDTLDMARRLLILPSYSLERVAQYLKVPQPEAHRALADVHTTRAVLLKLFERAQGARA